MKVELVFIPSPGIGHLRSTVELAKKLVSSNDHLSITVIIIPYPQAPGGSDNFASLSTTTSQDRLRYETISVSDQLTKDTEPSQVYIEKQKQRVKDALTKLMDRSDSPKLAGFVVDMFCTSMMDVAHEFGVPCYMMYTSNATFLAMALHVQLMFDEKKYDVTELDESVNELEFPCLTRPFPVKCLPHIFASKEWLSFFLTQARNFRKMKGILVNTVTQLESHALGVFSGTDLLLPQTYPVGPLLHLENETRDSDDEKRSEILRWLDEQPPKSISNPTPKLTKNSISSKNLLQPYSKTNSKMEKLHFLLQI